MADYNQTTIQKKLTELERRFGNGNGVTISQGVPTGVARDGDLFYDAVNDNLYLFNQAEFEFVNTKGEDGTEGDQGDKGEKGDSGTDGIDGISGAAGSNEVCVLGNVTTNPGSLNTNGAIENGIVTTLPTNTSVTLTTAAVDNAGATNRWKYCTTVDNNGVAQIEEATYTGVTGAITPGTKEVGFFDVRGTVGNDALSTTVESATATYNGVTGTLTTTLGDAEITRLSITGDKAGNDAANTAVPEITDATWVGTSADSDLDFDKENFSGGQQLAFGNDIFVAGQGTSSFLYSTDGETWDTASNPISLIGSIIYANNLFVAVGHSGKIATSSNGTSWQSRTSNTTEQLYKVAYLNGTFVAVGKNGAIVNSDNGVGDWTSRDSDTTEDLRDVAHDGSNFIAAGLSGTVVTTPSITTDWTSQTTDVTGHLLAVSCSDSVCVAVGQSGLTLTSTSSDLTSWDDSTQGSSWLRAVTFGGGIFVIAGDGVGAYSSSNGTSWAHTSNASGGLTGSITYIDGKFYLVSPNVTVSSDGINWSPAASLPGSFRPGSKIATGNSIIVVSDTLDGAIWKSTFLAADSASYIFDSALASSPLVYDVPGNTTAANYIALEKTFLDGQVTAGNLSGVTIATVTDAVISTDPTVTGNGNRITHTAGGTAVDLSIVNTGGTGSTLVPTVQVTTQGEAGVTATQTSYIITADNGHSPQTLSSTFSNNLTQANALIKIRNHFINDDIGGFSAADIDMAGTSFDITSDTIGDEDPLSFILTQGTGGNLEASAQVQTPGTDTVSTGGKTRWTVIARGITYSALFDNASSATTQASEIATYLTNNGTGITATSDGVVLTVLSTASGNDTNFILGISIEVAAANQTATQPVVVNTDGGGSVTKDSLTITFDNGTARLYTFDSGITTIQVADVIAGRNYPGVNLQVNNNFYPLTSLTAGDIRVTFTYDTAIAHIDVDADDFVVTAGNTNGDLSISNVSITTQGADISGQTTFSIDLDNDIYSSLVSGYFSTESDAGSQASQIKDALSFLANSAFGINVSVTGGDLTLTNRATGTRDTTSIIFSGVLGSAVYPSYSATTTGVDGGTNLNPTWVGPVLDFAKAITDVTFGPFENNSGTTVAGQTFNNGSAVMLDNTAAYVYIGTSTLTTTTGTALPSADTTNWKLLT